MFRHSIKFEGLGTVKKNLRTFNHRKGREFSRGLKKAGLHLQRTSQKYYCPVQTGNLKDSAFTRAYGREWDTAVLVGYTAAYAAFVHEDLTKAHGKEFNAKHAVEIARAAERGLKSATVEGGMFMRGKFQQAKFLEKPARVLRPVLLRIIVTETKL